MKHINRTYNIHYGAMTEHDWDKLASVYKALPQFRGAASDGCPTWFGAHTEEGPYIWASVEPSGLLVAGLLDEADWQRWDAQFRSLASAALGFVVKDADE